MSGTTLAGTTTPRARPPGGRGRDIRASLRGTTPLAAGCALVLALLWASLFYHLFQIRQGEVEQARRDVLNLSTALAEQVSRLVAGVDQVMSLAVEDLERDPARFEFRRWLERSTSLRSIAGSVALFDARGDLLDASVPVTPERAKTNVADRPHFAYLASHVGAGLYIGRTHQGRLTGRRVFQVARRISGPDGAFRGILVVGLDPSYLARQFEALDMGANGSVALFGLDGYLRARAPAVAGMYDRDMLAHPPLRDAFAALGSALTATQSSSSVIDGTARLYGYRRVADYPLVVAVGKPLDAVLFLFRREVLRTSALGIAASAVVLLLLALLMHEFRRRNERERLLLRTQSTLAETEASFRAIFESSTDIQVVHRVSAEGEIRVAMINPAAAAARGADIVGRRLEEVLAPGVAGRARAAIAAVVATGRPVRVEDDAILANDRCYETVLIPLGIDADTGRVAQVFVTIRDVTHLREAERAIARSEARYRLLAETTTDVITRLDLDGFRREYVSPRCRDLLGFEPEELLGKVPSASMHPDDAPRARAAALALVAGTVPEGTATVAYRTRHRAGHWVWIESVMSLARDDAGRPAGLVCSLRDVTARREAEAALEEARDAAETARHQAEQASAAKTEFLATVSHEIRTPLNGVLGFTELLLEDAGLAATQRRHVERIHNAGAALRTVVDDILDFSKIEAGHVDLDLRAFGLRALADDALGIVRALAERKGLAVSLDVRAGRDGDAAGDATVVGDRDRLRQILLNLLNNAIKFTQAGSVALAVDGRRGGDGQGGGHVAVRFAVTDTGIGIAPDKVAGLFQRFAQVDSSNRRSFGGTGLGLAICRRLVERMGGRIGVDSVPGAGSTFWVALELPVGTHARADAPRPQPPPRRPALVLLAEDQDINRDLARAVIEAAGHRLDVVGDGAAAVAAVGRRAYDLVLMDVQMPVLDGIAAARRIRALPSPAGDVPIVAMTADVLAPQVSAILQAGMQAHLGKPIVAAQLVEAVERWARPLRGGTEPLAAEGAVDHAARGRLAAVVGAGALASLTERTLGQIGDVLHRTLGADGAAGRPLDPIALAGEAHALLAPAGTLGLVRVAALLGAVEAACRDGSALDGLLRDLAAAHRDAAAALAPRRHAA